MPAGSFKKRALFSRQGPKDHNQGETDMSKKMHRSYVLSGALLLATGAAVAQQETPKWEFAPAFEYVHTAALYGGQGYNCAGGGAGTQYNFTSMLGFVIDLNGCKAFGLSNEFGVGSKVNATQFSYLFGPRFTFRRSHMFQPFVDVTFGGILLGVNCNNGNLGNACGGLPTVPVVTPLATQVTLPSGVTVIVPRNPNATGITQNSFALTAGTGFDIKFSNHVALRLVQADYLFSRFGNSCQIAYCGNNNSQANFRLLSGMVFGWGSK
jgi:opacity protein-like surface antigen